MSKYLTVPVFAIAGCVVMVWMFTSLAIVIERYYRTAKFPYLVSDWARGFVEAPGEFGFDPMFFSTFGPHMMFYAIIVTLFASARY